MRGSQKMLARRLLGLQKGQRKKTKILLRLTCLKFSIRVKEAVAEGVVGRAQKDRTRGKPTVPRRPLSWLCICSTSRHLTGRGGRLITQFAISKNSVPLFSPKPKFVHFFLKTQIISMAWMEWHVSISFYRQGNYLERLCEPISVQEQSWQTRSRQQQVGESGDKGHVQWKLWIRKPIDGKGVVCNRLGRHLWA